jgi:hypothetical protein
MPFEQIKLVKQPGIDTSDIGTDRTPFRMKNHKIQGELVKGERGFGEVSPEGRITEPPPEETLESNYTEENEFAVAVNNEIEAHPLLDCQAFDGRDPKRDNVKPTGEDILDYARNNPEARLTLQPSLKLALENAERYRYSRSSTPTPKPAGM